MKCGNIFRARGEEHSQPYLLSEVIFIGMFKAPQSGLLRAYISKKLNYNNGSVNIRYHGKQMTSLKDLLLWITCLDICRGRTVARKCKFAFVLQLGICLSIPLDIEIIRVWLLMCQNWISNIVDISLIHKQSNFSFEICKPKSDLNTTWF